MFIDQVRIFIQAGKGGNGCLSFRREKGIPHGGPDGGRGGDGGSVILVSDESVDSLVYFRFHPLIKARRGAHGEGSNRSGKRGADLFLKVPVGTVVKDEADNTVLFDFTLPNQTCCAAGGGLGGRGNSSFASSTHQAPRHREEGKPGEEKYLFLELKLIADIGLVGFPNAGKSTFISKISAARPRIADYPFTTLLPHLGVVDLDDNSSFVIADIPGLIEGAHQGHGLGIQFLQHVERTRILAHIIDVSPYSERDPVLDYRIIQEELRAFNPDLLNRTQVMIANKIDLLAGDESVLERLKVLAREEKIPFLTMSALTGTGLKKVVFLLGDILRKATEDEKKEFV
ncbi:MAG: GTPase ObgE [Candidatus Aminicenantes bacterium]|nr:GTPase ObgE [Candidatus Aminicenantes bacterium]